MSNNPVALCNRALSAMGSQSSIVNLTEDSTEARECSKHFDAVRDALLAKAHWNFARRTRALSLLKTASLSGEWTSIWPEPPWGYSYAYPSDCVKFRYLYSKSPAVLGSDLTDSGSALRVILTNDPGAIAVYTARITETNVWEPEFVEAMVFILASRLSIPLSGDMNLMARNLQLAQMQIEEAKVLDANEGTNLQQHDPDWIVARGITFETEYVG